VILNRDHVSTEVFLARYPEERYDSFILGNSRSLAFHCRDWANYLPGSSPYHFDASTETLFGLWGKLNFLEHRGVTIRNVLVILDATALTATTNSAGHLFVKHPSISGESWMSFQRAFLDAYFSNSFLLKDLHYRLTSRLVPYTQDVLDSRVVTADPITNDLIFTSDEASIREQGEDYFTPPRFYRRKANPPDRVPAIGEEQERMLRQMRALLERQHSDFEIVISPLYDQRRLARTDLDTLCAVFGAERVHDFSGANEFTSDVHNYYETSHYRPRVARAILEQLYQRR
jgi:hypothetical protein